MKTVRREGNQPFSISRGSVTVKAYPLATGLWQLSWYTPDGSRARKAFADPTEARKFAEAKARELAGQTSHVRRLTPEEAADYEAAIAKLPPGEKLLTAVEFFVARHPHNTPRKATSEVVALFLADLERRGMSSVYRMTAGHYLGRFGRDICCPISDLSGAMFEAWLHGLGVAPKTQQGVRGLVVGLFNFAKSKRLVSREHALEIAEVRSPKVVVGRIHTLEPSALGKFLQSLTPDELPAVALLAFCPLRTAEVARMDWADVRLAERVLIVNASVAKVSVRRVVPIPEVGLAWLEPYGRNAGPVWPFQPDPDGDRLAHRLPLMAKAAQVPYAKNILRHSVISALMATEADAARVSLWAGNSPRVVATNYSARWTPVQGREWFAVRPQPIAPNVVSLSNTQAA